jgi:hypothetical protein
MDFTQSMDNGYMIPSSVAVGSGEATDIRCVCDTVEDFKAFLDTTGMELRYEGLVTYEKVNKRLMVYEGNNNWKVIGEGGGDVDLSNFITLTQLSQQLGNYYTKTQTDNKISEEIAKAQIGGSGEVDLSAYATKNYVDDEISKIELKEGPQGPKGDKGDTGLTGPAGPAYNDSELRSLIASLTKRVEELEKGNTNPPTEDEVKPVEAKSYCGQMNFKSVDIVTIEDLEGLANIVDVVKPQTTYAHSGSTVYNKTLICAIPKSKGSVSSVVDGAGVDITASYPVVEKTLNGVVYSISCNKVAQAYNKSTVVKFNIN